MKFRHQESVKKRSGIAKLLLIVVPIIAVFLIISLISVNRWYNNNLQPVDPNNTSEITFIIEPGTSVRDIASDLQEQGVIRNATAFSWFVSRSDEWDELQAGTYTLSPMQSVEDIVTKLAGGDVDTELLTIFPGRRLDQLAEDLAEAGYTQDEINSALAHEYESPILKDKPATASLEGYVFPETYKITTDTTLINVFDRALDEFSVRVSDEMLAGFAQNDLNLHEAITLASIVSGESSVPKTQQKIAGVFFNRLERGMTLGADVTFLYAAAITGEEPSTSIDSPYNTRIYAGLPPGPISNFNISALEAVADPIITDDLFFVTGDDGTTYFAETAAGHQSNVDSYCFERCLLP